MSTLSVGVTTKIVSSGRKPIESKGASTAGFVGQSVKGPVNKPILITSWSNYLKHFSSFSEAHHLAHAVNGFFQNGGSRCYVLNVGAPKEGEGEKDFAALVQGEDRGPAKRTGINTFDDVEDISLVAVPGHTSPEIQTIVKAHCAKAGNRVAVFDGVEDLGDLNLDQMSRPTACEDAAVYFPWLEVFDPEKKQNVHVPPSGHVCGLIARVDHDRGVHKPPANEPLRGVVGLKYNLTREEQNVLNPQGINCIRNFGDLGIKVYGARTLSADSEWKYLNVRRLFHVVRASLQAGTEWVVFEPNNPTLWGDIRRNVAAYLKILWNEGALVGNTPEEAFFVKCDEETNPPENVDNGVVTIQVGISPVKPAEFVLITVQQKYEKEDKE
jgi:uncharacterized protein